MHSRLLRVFNHEYGLFPFVMVNAVLNRVPFKYALLRLLWYTSAIYTMYTRRTWRRLVEVKPCHRPGDGGSS